MVFQKACIMIGPVGILKTACGYFEKQHVTAVTEALKILALPKKGGGESDPCQDFLVDL